MAVDLLAGPRTAARKQLLDAIVAWNEPQEVILFGCPAHARAPALAAEQPRV